jgi:class 3 adenylate cyclase
VPGWVPVVALGEVPSALQQQTAPGQQSRASAQEGPVKYPGLAGQIRTLSVAMDRHERRAAGAAAEITTRTGYAPEGAVALVRVRFGGVPELWEADEAAASAALDLAAVVVRATVRDWVGYEVTGEPSSYQIAFSDPLNAVRFAIGLQSALLAAPWGDAVLRCAPAASDALGLWRGLRAGVGVHLGMPTRGVDPNTRRIAYFGPDVILSDELGSAAVPGQVLVTADLRRVIADHIAKLPRLQVVDIEEHILKGIEGPVQIFQVTEEKLSGRRFGDIRSVSSVVRTYISRDQQIAASAPDAGPAPVGRVALVFTNVLQSGKLWKHDADLASQSLSIHNEVIRQVLGEVQWRFL